MPLPEPFFARIDPASIQIALAVTRKSRGDSCFRQAGGRAGALSEISRSLKVKSGTTAYIGLHPGERLFHLRNGCSAATERHC
jgi:hypothetical protein